MSYVLEIKGDLLDFPVGIEAIAHCCNCFHTMGSGLAKKISQRIPNAKDVDLNTELGDPNKLGTFSFACGEGGKVVYNIYGQFDFGVEKRHLDYEALFTGIEEVYKDISESCEEEYAIGFPKFMGSFRAGGEWEIVRAGIECFANKYKINTVIVELEK